MSGPMDNRPGGPKPQPPVPGRVINGIEFTAEILAEAAAAPPPRADRLALVVSLLGSHLPTVSARQSAVRAVAAKAA